MKDSRFERHQRPRHHHQQRKQPDDRRSTSRAPPAAVCRYSRGFRESGRRTGGSRRVVPGEDAVARADDCRHGCDRRNQNRLRCAPLLKAMPPARARRDRAGLPPMDTWVERAIARFEGRRRDRRYRGPAKSDCGAQGAVPAVGPLRGQDTITLQPDTVLIGLHPNETQIDLLDSTPGFQGPGAPKPLLLAPRGGRNIVTGIGLYTGGINSRAVARDVDGRQGLADGRRALPRRTRHERPQR